MLTDTLSSTSSTAHFQSPYPTRYPKLGVSAVLRSKSISPKTFESPLRLDEPPSVTCRFRPGLRPVRIVDMSNFRFKRKQMDKNVGPNMSDSQMQKSSSLLLQSRRQPLKAFQQNCLPTVPTIDCQPQDSPLSVQDSLPIQKVPHTITKSQRISTNPKVRRYSSTEMATSRRCVADSLAEHAFEEVGNGQSRKRRSMPIRPGKKTKFRDSMESMESNVMPVRATSSCSSTPTSTLANDAATYPSVKAGVMTRIRSQTQLAYEAVKRVVRRHSKRRSGSYELRRNTEIY